MANLAQQAVQNALATTSSSGLSLGSANLNSLSLGNGVGTLPPQVNDLVKKAIPVIGTSMGGIAGAEAGAALGAVAGYSIATKLGLDTTQGALFGAIAGAAAGAGVGAKAGQMFAQAAVDNLIKNGILV